VEAVDGDVHLLPLAQGLEPVEDAFLVGELQVLKKAQVHVEPHQLIPEKDNVNKIQSILSKRPPVSNNLSETTINSLNDNLFQTTPA
jgi:hypothetical protein